MKKQTMFAFLILAFIGGLTGCKKNETLTSGSGVTTKNGSKLSGGDGKWDLLGYGYDVTGNLIDAESVSDAPIIDLSRFEIDYRNRIDVNTTSSGNDQVYAGATAVDYFKDVISKRSAGFNATIGDAAAEKKNYFTGSLVLNAEDQNSTNYSSKYSYATFESFQKIKRIRFTADATIALLNSYLTPEFVNNVANLDADALVARYGTHVLLDISLGGRFRLDYSGYIISESENEKKVKGAKAGLGISVLKLFSVNLTGDMSQEEITRITNESRSKQYTAKYYGGTNSGRSISIDLNGNTTESFNLASWQQSVNDRNCALIDVGNAVPLYEFISDPIKKNQVLAAVEKHIRDNQPKELEYRSESVPVNSYTARTGGHHYLTTGVPGDLFHWQFENVAFRAFNRQVPGTVPVNVFYSHQGQDHYYVMGGVDNYNYWTSEGVAFYAYPTQVPGTVPVYEHYSSKGLEHYYSIASNVGAPSYWTNPAQRIAFYAYSN